MAEADIVDDEQGGPDPGLEALGMGAIGAASVEVVEQVDAASVAHGALLLARAQAEGFEDVAFAGTGLPVMSRSSWCWTKSSWASCWTNRWSSLGWKVPIEGFDGLGHDARRTDVRISDMKLWTAGSFL